MLSNLILSYPSWTIILVLLTGLMYAGLLYFRNRSSKLGKVWTVILFTFRFLAVSILAFLLLSPYIKTKKRVVEKPIVVFGIDNSTSMVLGNDTTYDLSSVLSQINETASILKDDYTVDTWLFAEDATLEATANFSGEVSDYAQMFKQLNDNYAGANLGAMVIVGDGIYNRGIDPIYAASAFDFPIYTVALGDTGVNRDMKVNEVRYNSIVYLNDQFPIEVNVSAAGLKGDAVILKVFAFGKLLAQKKFVVNNNAFNRSFSFYLKAEQLGNQRIRIVLETEAEEINKENNQRSIFVEVLNNRQKILILAHAPHPDLGALKEAVEQSRNYLADIQYIDKLKAKITDYDLVILHQLPSGNYPVSQLIPNLEKLQIPILFILGKQSTIPLFNKYFMGLDIRSATGSFEEARADINPAFSLFTFPSKDILQLESLPPLQVPLGNYSISSGAEVFAWQEINRISTDFPLVAFSGNTTQRLGVILGEGLWLWRMYNYLNEGNAEVFNAFVDKTVQLLLAKKDKRHFRVITKGTYPSHQNVMLKAELYNQSYEAVNESDVSLKLSNEDGEQFNYVFSPYNNSYQLDLKQLAEGVYKYHAQTSLGTNNYSAKGEFVVNSQSLENRNLQANHRMLFRLADEHDGQLLYPSQIESLPGLLSARDDLKSKIHYEEYFSALHTLLLIMLVIIALLSAEWFLRKYLGSY